MLHEIDRLDKERKKLENELLEFQKQHDLTSPQEKQNLINQYIVGIDLQLINLQAEKEVAKKGKTEELELLNGREIELKKSKETWENKLLELNHKLVKHDMLKSNLVRCKELSEKLTKQLREIDMELRTKQNEIKIYEPATVPSFPIGPDRIQEMVARALGGLSLFGWIMWTKMREP